MQQFTPNNAMALAHELEAYLTQPQRASESDTPFPTSLSNLLQATRAAHEPHAELTPELLAPPEDEPAQPITLLELAFLIAAAKGEAGPTLEPEEGPLYCGYRLYRDARQSRVCFFPSLAARLCRACQASASDTAPQTLAAAFGEIWRVDLTVWEALQQGSPRAAVLAWLRSPGRRLLFGLWDLEAHLKRPDPDLQRAFLSAAGWNTDAPLATADQQQVHWQWLQDHRPPEWLELHSTSPGYRHVKAKDATSAVPAPVPPVQGQTSPGLETLLEQLSDARPALLRARALRLLLDRAVDRPVYALEGMQRRLTDDLGLYLLAAQARLDARPDDPQEKLEALCIRLSQRLLPPRSPLLQVWGLSRWLVGLFIAAEQPLEVFLLSLRPLAEDAGEPRVGDEGPLERDAFSPSRFGTGPDAFSVRDLATLRGVLDHYFAHSRRQRERRLLPMPLSLLEILRTLAARSESQEEADAERALQAQRNALHWDAPHVSPPWLARWIMTFEIEGLTWLGKLDAERQEACIQALARDPVHFEWVSVAIHQERTRLKPKGIEALVPCWEALQAARQAEHATLRISALRALLYLVPAALAHKELRQLSDEALVGLQEEMLRLEDKWHPLFFDLLLEAAEQAQRWQAWRPMAEALRAQLDHPDTRLEQREALARRALLRFGTTRHPQRAELLKSLLETLSGPAFAVFPAIVREVRRLGG